MKSARPLVLAYHAICSNWRSSLAVPEAIFEEQMAYLRERGYVGLTCSEMERRRAAGTLPAKAVAITFDDGFCSVMRAAPPLAAFDFPATVFAVTSFAGLPRPLDWYGIAEEQPPDVREMMPLSWSELGELANAGWEVGSHTHRHPLLTTLDGDALADELGRSKDLITEHLGRCQAIAYPYGQSNPVVAAAAREAGYFAGFVLTGAHDVDEPHQRPRVRLSGRDTGPLLRLKLSRLGLWSRRSAPAVAVRRMRRPRRWMPDAR